MESNAQVLTSMLLCGDDQSVWQRFYELVADVLQSIAEAEQEEQAA